MMRLLPLAAIVLVSLASACRGDEPERGTSATPASITHPATSPSPTAALSPRGDIELLPGEDAPFPDDMAFLIETGCWACDGGPEALIRVYRDPAGSPRSETLLDPDQLGYGPREVRGGAVATAPPYVNGLAGNPDASVLAASVCIKLSCAPRGLDEWYPDSVSVILRSNDGGVTWSEIARGGPALSVLGLVGDEVLVSNYRTPEGPPEYSLLPSGAPLKPPVDIGTNRPLAASGQVLWRTNAGQLLLNDGTEFLRLPGSDAGEHYIQNVTGMFSGLDKGSALVQWADIESPPPSHIRITGVDIGMGVARLGTTLYTERIFYVASFGPKDADAVISIEAPGNVLGGPIPAFLDLTTGRYRLITDPFRTPGFQPQSAKYVVRAIQTGPFARIVNTGSCLRIRAEPSLAAESLHCLADGVLLQHTGETREADAVTWLSVVTPGRRPGWASTAFLER
jgi:hypothetical protein